MRHHRADQFAKNLLRDALSAATASETEVGVVAATQKIDVYAVPDPERAAERPKMGLLGDLAAEPALFEPFRNTPSLARIRRCLAKQLAWHHELERRARASAKAQGGERTAPPSVAFPWLVVISPGLLETVIEVFGCKPVRPGVYEAVAGLRMRIVVLAELARARETLLLRLLGAGRRFEEALADLVALPIDAWEPSIVGPLVVHFRLASHGEPGTKEDEVSAEIRAWFEQVKNEARREGRDEGRAEEGVHAVLTVLRARGIPVSDSERARILTQKDPERLERWLEKAAVAASVAEVLDDPS